MSPILLANLLAQLGTVALPLIVKLMGDINAGKTATTVTPEDLAELGRLANQSSSSIYASLGIALPPPTAVSQPTPPTPITG